MIAKYEFYANEPLRRENKNPEKASPSAKQSEAQESEQAQQKNFEGVMRAKEPDDGSHLDE